MNTPSAGDGRPELLVSTLPAEGRERSSMAEVDQLFWSCGISTPLTEPNLLRQFSSCAS
jgi:hypothetical protein